MRVLDEHEGAERPGDAPRGPDVAAIIRALERHADDDGAVPAGVADRLVEEEGWRGRLMDVLAVLTEDEERMGYLAGGRRPEEVATWLSLWADSALTLEEIRLVVASGGWDPEPFAVLSREGLLERLLRQADGTERRVRGELAGGWVSDELALAPDDEILRRVRQVLDADQETVSPPPADRAGA